jgi:plastocyanin
VKNISLAVAALVAFVSLSYAVQVPVSIVDNLFQPDTVTINRGDSVIWTNNGTFLHTSTSGVDGVWDSLWDSGNMAHGVTFIRGFQVDGTFDYFCRHHYLGGMKGVVVVGASGVNETPGTKEKADRMASSPNPFRLATTIRLAPTRVAPGAVRVFGASGKLVRKIETTHGTSVTWDGTDTRGQQAEPGVYFFLYGSGALAVTRLR